MKIDKAFRDTLELVKPAVGVGSSIPQLNHIWFDGTHVSATNAALGVRLPCKTDFTGGVLGAVLLGLLPDADNVEGELTAANDGLVLKQGRSKVKLPALDAENNPWGFGKKVRAIGEIKLTKEFLAGLARVNCIKAQPPVRVEHWGVTMFPDGDGVLLYTTDAKSAAEVYVSDTAVSAKLERTVLPRSFVAMLLAFAAPGDVCVVTEEFLSLRTKTGEVYSTFLDPSTVQDLPKMLGGLIPKKARYTPVPIALAEALRRIEVLNRGGKPGNVRLRAEGKKLVVSGTYAHGELSETFLMKEAVPAAAEIQVNCAALETGLAVAESFCITDRALILSGPEKADIIFLIAAHVETGGEKEREEVDEAA